MTALLLAAALFGQALVAPQQVYTTADPVRSNAIALATPDGRFVVSMADNCADSGIGPGMNVELWQVQGFSGIGTIAPLDDPNRLCGVRFEQLADPTPCFTNAEGACDVALEQPED